MSILGKFLYYGEDAHLSHVNPGFYIQRNDLTKNPYKINCVSCAIATDLNLGDVRDITFSPFIRDYISVNTIEQNPTFSAVPLEQEASVFYIEYVYEKSFEIIVSTQSDSGNQSDGDRYLLLSDGMNNIVSRIRTAGRKSRGIILVQTDDAGSRHVFNVWNKGEKVEFLDGQNNKIVTGFSQSIERIELLITSKS
jgi:Papain fold toxin 1, glutamine deamidase